MPHTQDLSGLEQQLNQERQKVDVDVVSFSVREIVRMFEEGELSIAPSYQRKYRWSEEVASTFIESVFLGLPIPPIFVATNADFQWEVVDGLQRISTLILYLNNGEDVPKRLNREGGLALKGLGKLSQLNGSEFRSLPISLQRYFARQPIQVISLTDKSDREVRFDLFERLNAGSISLTPQEVRSAVYRGDFIDFLEEMSRHESFSNLLKLQESNKHDGTPAEQVLKFFAYKNARSEFTGAVKEFLNNYAKDATAKFDYSHERKVFKESFDFLNEVVGGPFLRENTNVTPLVQFEACAVAVGELIEQGSNPVRPRADWLEDAQLTAASRAGSNTKARLRDRIDRAKELVSSD